MRAQLLLGHRHRNARVGPRGELLQDLLADPAQHGRRDPGPQRVEVLRSHRVAPTIGPHRVPFSQSPLGLEGEIVDPVHERGELRQTILERSPGQHQPPRGLQPLDGQRGLGCPVLDALGFVEHDQVWCEPLELREILEDLLVVDDQESRLQGAVLAGALCRRPVDDGGGHAREELPLAQPLRLERRGHDDEALLHSPRGVQHVTRRDGLRGLSQAHVVGEQQPSRVQEPRNSSLLVREQRALQLPERALRFSRGRRCFELPGKAALLALEEPHQRRVRGRNALEPGQQRVDELATLERATRGRRLDLSH